MPEDTDPARERQLTRDPDTIEQWAREHDVVPVRVGDAGEGERYRMVPENEMTEEDERMEWEAFAEELEGGEQVVIYHGEEASEPLEVTGHQDAIADLDDDEIEQRLLDGETVTSTITETRVVESVVVEELDIESKLVDTEIVEDRVVDAELLNLECTRCDLETVEGEDVSEWFDTDRYLDAVADVHRTTPGAPAETSTEVETGAETTDAEAGRSGTSLTDARTGAIEPEDDVFPYRGELEVEETWTVTREFTAEHTVESTITGHEVTEADTLEDYDLESADLHRTILEQGVFESERPSDELLTHYDVESEVAGDDTIHTTFTGTRRVEDELVDRKRLTTEVTGGEFLGMDLMNTRDLDAPGFEEDATTDTMTETTETTETTATTDTTTGRMEVSEDVVGNTVVNAAGDEIGVVSGVEPDADALYVDAEPGIAEKIKTALGWGDHHDEDDYRLGTQEIAGMDDDTVRLKGQEEIDEGDRR